VIEGRLLAGGGPASPNPRVLRALTTPLIGQFDPDFTRVMDDVVELGRETFHTSSPHCFAVSALGPGGLEAVLNSVLEEGTPVVIGGSPRFVAETADIARCLGGLPTGEGIGEWFVVPLVDPYTCQLAPVHEIAAHVHTHGGRIVVDATLGLGACELRVDEWGIDVCVAGADYALGAPSGTSLVTYSPDVQAHMQARKRPPRISYLDLLQLQAYWSPARLNHHTAPTSLVYGLREALRLAQPVADAWTRHAETGRELRAGLARLALEVSGDPPYAVVHLPTHIDDESARKQLAKDFGVHVTRVAPRTWRLGLLGADARPEAVNVTLAALEKICSK
jgi:(S)-ureidoglycine---glyoxylate transaminase